jgi:cobaltochelatase CobT
MRGEKIIHTAAWCILIAEWMDRLRISIEILGYTTRAWKGGQSREAWLAAGKPTNPGRLNDLRHLIYKSFSASISASAPNFGLMAREGLLKENIDGEAILWAASRLQQQPSTNRILFVISDGAPVDDSTLSTNPANYLEKHLLAVIDTLSTKLSLYAIGVGYDVSRYYPNAITLNNASELGPRFFEALVNDPVFARSFSSLRPKKRYRYGASDDKE